MLCSSNSADERLTDAAEEAFISGKLTPLIKEELWCVIQSRRLSRGCEELVVDSTETKNNSCDLSVRDLTKRCTRMEQNRRAARKYREKRKQEEQVIKQETGRLLTENKRLKEELAELQAEKTQLQMIILDHLKQCPLDPERFVNLEPVLAIVDGVNETCPAPEWNARPQETETDICNIG